VSTRAGNGREASPASRTVRTISAKCVLSLRQDRPMRAVLKSLDLEPAPSVLPDDPAEFSILARMIVGPPDTPGEESFDVTVCTPEWLAKACSQAGGFYSARHHLVVSYDEFNQRALRVWLAARVQEVTSDTWAGIGKRLGRLGYWEFEDNES
jgi:hypothetical protein